MKTTPTSIGKRSLAIAVALAATLTLGGCFANPLDQIGDKISEEIAKGGAEKLIEGATGGQVDLNIEGELPADIPSEVPIPDGKVLTSMKIPTDGGTMWTVTFVVGDPKAAMNDMRAKLLAAGFEEFVWNEGGLMSGVFGKGQLSVTVGAVVEEDSSGDQNLTFGVIKSNEKS